MSDAGKVPRFDIPAAPRVETDLLAVQEASAFDREWKLKFTKGEWWIRAILRLVLFTFILWLNVYWAHNVILMVWKSGMAGSGFHVGDGVLIALVTTSIANFIALVIIVAKHLFPS